MDIYKNFNLESIAYFNEKEELCFEQWEDISGYDGRYQISNLGRVKSIGRYINSKNNSLQFITGKIMKFTIHKGYLRISLCKDQIHKHHFINRLVAIAFIPNPENKPEVNHIKGNKLDNRWFMLEWNTKSENVKHAFRIGLKNAKKGEKCNFSKLTEKQVLEIRKNTNSLSMIDLGKKYGVARATIYDILKRRRWAHI